jgi:hypothetical protein
MKAYKLLFRAVEGFYYFTAVNITIYSPKLKNPLKRRSMLFPRTVFITLHFLFNLVIGDRYSNIYVFVSLGNIAFARPSLDIFDL